MNWLFLHIFFYGMYISMFRTMKNIYSYEQLHSRIFTKYKRIFPNTLKILQKNGSVCKVMCICTYIAYIDTYALAGSRTGKLKSSSPTVTFVDKTLGMFYDSPIWSYSRKLRRNWHIQIQLIRNWGKGETQQTFIVKPEKKALTTTCLLVAIFYITELQYKFLCEHLWISNESHNLHICLKFL